MAKRVRGQGSVRFRDGRWEARVQISGHRHTDSFDSEAKAWDWIAQQKTDVSRGVTPAPATAPSKRFDDLCRLYKVHKEKRWRPGSLAFFECHRDGVLLPHFGKRRIAEIRALDLQSFLDAQLGRPILDREGQPTGRVVQAGTVAKYQQLLGQLFRYAVRMDFLASNPMTKVERVRAEPRDQRVLRLHEVQTVLAACSKEQRSFFTVLALTGLRRSEIFRMRWDWVDFEGQRLHVRVAKRGANELPLGPAVAAILKPLRGKPADLVFPGRGGEQLTCKAGVLGRLVTSAGIPGGVGLHSFRRGFLTILERLPGVSYSVVKALARHSMRSGNDITARYLYPDFDELLAALTLLERRILPDEEQAPGDATAPSNVVQLKPRRRAGTAAAPRRQRVQSA